MPATLGNPNALQIGDEAFVVGNPLGLYSSMSAGVISGLERSFDPPNGQEIKHLIQIDAAVNPGNSGGPLLNRAGQVVGIVTALINPTKQDVFIGIGLAVPINVAGGRGGGTAALAPAWAPPYGPRHPPGYSATILGGGLKPPRPGGGSPPLWYGGGRARLTPPP